MEQARDLYNIARLLWHTELLERIDIKLISKLLTETENHLKLLNLQENVWDISSKELLNVAIEDVIFDFTKIGENELQILANDIVEEVSKVRRNAVKPKPKKTLNGYLYMKNSKNYYRIITYQIWRMLS